MGATTSKNQKKTSPIVGNSSKFHFEQLPSELRLLIFTFLPYTCLVRCLRLNRSAHYLIMSNWILMKKYDGFELELRMKVFDEGYRVYLGIASDATNQILQICLGLAENAAFIRTSRHFQKMPSCNIVYKNAFDKFVDKWKKSVRRSKHPITSIMENLELHLQFLFQQIHFFEINMEPEYISNQTAFFKREYAVAILELMNKYQTKTRNLRINHIDITPGLAKIIEEAVVERIILRSCTFENSNALSDIAKCTERLYIDNHPPTIGFCDNYSFTKFLEVLFSGECGRLESLVLSTPLEEAHMYCRCISKVFHCDTPLVPENFQDVEIELIADTSRIIILRLSNNGFGEFHFKIK